VRVRRRTWLLVAAAGVVAVAAVALWPHVQEYTGVAAPTQVDHPVVLDPALAGDYPTVLGVAHNAGNNPATTSAALAAGADVVEIDVVSARGTLVAGRDHGWPWLAGLVFRGPTLADAWQYAADARAVKLDLKQDDRALLDDLVTFLRDHRTARRVMVSAPEADALVYLHERLPGVTLLASVNSPDGVRRLQASTALQQAVGGISAFEGLVTAALLDWAHRRGLVVLAWTVDGQPRLDQLVRLGVDGVTTANLAVLRALS
jgi:glycerophosphoryl diester phosphodiesterase